ncbi:MAG: hypothetical protein H6684_11195 [Deltaproteobacteria bacterium]|nr:hypothetical protein [Deltaproteobacteria bacterium]MCB9478303.1 hypothetical protein [Deltaproteobacteria bacterium]MCB9489287.1 hypothetical protein [Deltaproteobacteria bacterium]
MWKLGWFFFGAAALILAGFLAISCASGDDDDGDSVDDDDDDDCEAIYEASLASECMSYSGFEFYGCSPDEPITDPDCFLECVNDLEDGEALCYDTEVCVNDCSEDDASGCANGYYGMANEECLSYRDFYLMACDPRGDSSVQACVWGCFENEASCDDFEDCLDFC